MTPNSARVEEISSYITQKKVVTVPELMNQFGYSRATIFRVFVDVDYLTSYNVNNTGITLASLSKFDTYGIWKFGKYYFSKWPTLNETIQHLIDSSPAGLYPKDLQEILGVRVNNHLSLCTRKGLLIRNHDFGHPLYFSVDNETKQRQYEQRKLFFQESRHIEKVLLTKEKVIKILIVIIKHHVTTIDKLMPILSDEGIYVSEQSVKWVFKKYGIEKKGFR